MDANARDLTCDYSETTTAGERFVYRCAERGKVLTKADYGAGYPWSYKLGVKVPAPKRYSPSCHPQKGEFLQHKRQ